jgi:hypothetical protein
LILAKTLQADRGNFTHPQQLGSFDSTMPGDERSRSVDEDRIGEAKFADTVCDLANLSLGMSARISRIRI